MTAQILGRFRSVFVSVSVTVFVAGCVMQASEPEDPKAGDVVTPGRASAATGEGISTPSLYEYSDRYYVTTGKRIRFRADNAFLTATNRSDGPKSNIGLHYDGSTLDQFTLGGPGQVVSAVLESHAGGGNLTPENITRAETSFGLFGYKAGDLSFRGHACGLDAYDVVESDYTTRIIARYGLTPSAAEFRSRWGGSMLFALRDNGGAYSDVIACDQTFSTCTATTSYRNWPVQLFFPNQWICDYANVVSDARRMFDRFYLDETERSPGQVERRWSPISIRAKAS